VNLKYQLSILKKYLKSIFPEFIINYFTQGNERSLKTKKNIAASVIIKGLNIAISLLLVPLTINYINPTKYGVWLTLSSVIGWFGFFDIGFGNGLRNRFAEALAKGKHELARIYVSTTYAILSIIIGVVLVIFIFINPFLNWAIIINTPSTMTTELSLLAMIVFVFFSVQFVLQLITTIITANQQPAKSAFLYLLGNIFSLIVIFILTKSTSGNLLYLGIALSSAPVLVLALSSLWFYGHSYKNYAPSFKYVRFKFARDLMSLGVKFFGLQIAVILLYQTSNIIISQLFGPEQVTPYNIAFKYFSIITMVYSIILTPFWSAFTEAYTKKDLNWIRLSMKKLKSIWLLLIGAIILMILFSNTFYFLWVGNTVHVPMSITIVMALYVMINLWNAIYSTFLNGVGHIKFQLVAGLIGALVNIPLSIYLGKTIGISGVILSTAILGLPGFIFYPMQYHKIIHFKAKGIWS